MRSLWQPWVLSLVLCAAASVGGACGSNKSVSSRDAAILADVPANTGGFLAGGATGSSAAGGGAGALDGAARATGNEGAAGAGGGAVDADKADVPSTGGSGGLASGGAAGGGGGTVDAGRADVPSTGGMSGSTTGGAAGTGGASAKAGSTGTGGASARGGTSGIGGASAGSLVTLVGTYTTIANPCTTDPCVPGMVAAIDTGSDKIILLVDGHWIMNGAEHFNGFRPGEALELTGYNATGGIEIVSMKHIITGSGGAGGSSGTGGAGGVVTDPGTGGPRMVRMPEGFFIDATEVTRGQYEAWLATSPSAATPIEGCESNTSFVPECGGTSPCQGDDCNRPQVCVDWCDAAQYCKAVGKRLCGSLGQDPTQREWVTACSAHGRNLWVYGNDYDRKACNVYDLGLGVLNPVGAMSGCQSTVPGYQGVYDLIGNVYEWQQDCNGSSCVVRGASYDRIGRDDIQDRCTDYRAKLRNSKLTDIGFRCCAS